MLFKVIIKYILSFSLAKFKKHKLTARLNVVSVYNFSVYLPTITLYKSDN